MAGRPRKGGGVEITTERTRPRQPRAAAEAAAAATMARGVGARVFALHGGPVAQAAPEPEVDGGGSVALDWYRSRESNNAA